MLLQSDSDLSRTTHCGCGCRPTFFLRISDPYLMSRVYTTIAYVLLREYYIVIFGVRVDDPFKKTSLLHWHRKLTIDYIINNHLWWWIIATHCISLLFPDHNSSSCLLQYSHWTLLIYIHYIVSIDTIYLNKYIYIYIYIFMKYEIRRVAKVGTCVAHLRPCVQDATPFNGTQEAGTQEAGTQEAGTHFF